LQIISITNKCFMINDNLEIQLKERVLTKSGIINITETDCRLISELVFLKTKNYISESNLKRIYGFSRNSNVIPTPFVLNSLSQFIGFENWKDFVDQESFR